MNPQEFITAHRNLIQLERDAELEEAKKIYTKASLNFYEKLQCRGDAILHLKASQPSDNNITSIGGRQLINLKKISSKILPAHKITVGDNVAIQSMQFIYGNKKNKKSVDVISRKKAQIDGVVYKVYNDYLVIALNRFPNEDEIGFSIYNSNLFIFKLPDDVT